MAWLLQHILYNCISFVRFYNNTSILLIIMILIQIVNTKIDLHIKKMLSKCSALVGSFIAKIFIGLTLIGSEIK